MEQAGIYKIDLYENYNTSATLETASKVISIGTSGQEINIVNQQRPTFKQNYQKGANRILTYDYEISFILWDFSIANLQLLNTIKNSPFGFLPVLTFYNGLQQIALDPVFLDGSINFNAANSASFKVVMKNKIEGSGNNNTNTGSTKRLIEFSELSGFLLINDTDFLYISDFGKLLISG